MLILAMRLTQNRVCTHTWEECQSTACGFHTLNITERIVLDERYGIGIDTGTSFLIEQR